MSHAFDDDFVSPALDAAQIVHRVDDWRRRVDDLLQQIETWGNAAGLHVQTSEPVVMHEELMKRFDVPPVNLKTLYIDRQGAFVAKVAPVGLWTIGANGRVDLKTRRGVFTMVDTAEHFARPLWRVSGPEIRDAPELSEQTFLRALLA